VCGIGGRFGRFEQPAGRAPTAGPPEVVDLDLAPLSIRHRGPDDADAVHLQAPDGTPAFLSFTRLAILDLSPAGRQPMRSDDGQQVLVYNGEIYNHLELREELQARGQRFRSRSDTEVVLRGLVLDGERFLRRLRGMFALALWDGRTGEFLLARDSLGIKPLYLTCDGQRLVFASEVRAIVDAGAAARRLDRRALLGYLCLGSVPEPHTLVDGVQALPAGHLLRARAVFGRVELSPPRRFLPPPAWPPPWLGSSTSPLVQQAAELRPLLRETAALHLGADVAVALLLSGGVDSTALAALLRGARPDAELAAFTLTRPDDPDETEAAAQTARALGLRHHVVTLSDGELRARVPAFLAALDQPSVDGLNTFVLSGAVRAAGFKVALSGLGADELFGGYALQRRLAWLWPLVDGAAPLAPLWGALGQGLGRLPLSGRAAKAATLLSAGRVPRDGLGAALLVRLRGLLAPSEAAELVGEDPALVEHTVTELALAQTEVGSLPHADPALRRAVAYHGAVLLLRSGYLKQTLLRDADALSMAHGLELRVPLCDERLWQAVLARPPHLEAPPKQLLIAAAAHPRVEAVARRRKRGFVLPLERFLCGPLRPLVHDRLAQAAALGLSAPAAAALAGRFYARPSSARAHRLWALCTLTDYLARHRLSPA
jgi:asparagine synthase (glutamine-hydrolysing)